MLEEWRTCKKLCVEGGIAFVSAWVFIEQLVLCHSLSENIWRKCFMVLAFMNHLF